MEAELWLTKLKTERQRLLASIPFDDPQFLEIVSAPAGWGVFASAGPHFRHAIFGRDLIAVASYLCDYNQDLAHEIIHALARLQGNILDPRSEEEPGKIHHEYRSAHFSNVAVSQESLDILNELQNTWGKTGQEEMVYYGSYDATPSYIRLVAQYTARYGGTILDEPYTDRSGHQGTIRGSVLFAAEWLTAKMQKREDHLLAYCRLNPVGLENQVWKDSHTSSIFSDGSLPDFDAGIVSVELQGYAYDALLYAAELSEDQSPNYLQLARDIQEATLTKLWRPEDNFFAQGLGTDSNGTERQLDTLTSNAGLLLDSRLLADLPDDTRQKYVDGVVTTIMSPQFLTEAGVRCRAIRHSGLPGYIDYHGSHVVWPKDTYEIARGLERAGYTQEAYKLYDAIVRSIQRAGEFYEFFYAEEDGTVWYDASEGVQHFTTFSNDSPLAVPEQGQAWTIAAAIASSYKLSQTG